MRRGNAQLRERLLAALRHHGLLDPACTMLVATSGGLDSVCLLHLLRFAPSRPRLVAAHFDHRMRSGSGRDADWVRGLCTAWSVPFSSDVAAEPPRSEAAARALRYAFLQRAAEDAAADRILTAHHADDQAETVLFRLARGTGPTGLAGIPARRGSIIRPLLRFTRAELLQYARACGINWRDDPTNRDLRYDRNRIRLRVIPALEAVRPGAARRIAALAGRAAEAEAAWRSLLRLVLQDVVSRRDDNGFTLARRRLLAYHPHVRARALRYLAGELGCRLSRAGTRSAIEFINSGGSGRTMELSGGIVLAREFDRLLLCRRPVPPEPADSPLEIESAAVGSGAFRVGRRRYVAQWAPAGHGGASGAVARFDLSALRFPLWFRGWRPGDRIRLPFGSKKVKELFRERRIGRSDRVDVPVLLDADGHVLWVVPIARADVAVPRPDHTAFEISVTDGDSD